MSDDVMVACRSCKLGAVYEPEKGPGTGWIYDEDSWLCPNCTEELVKRHTAEAATEPPYDSRPETHEHIAQVRGLLNGAAADLMKRGHLHDRSKLTEPELAIFDRVTPRLRGTTYGSPEYRGYLKSMGPGLAHHYRENDHHPEHFQNGIHDMDLLQMTELVADWLAATRRHDDGDIHRSIEQNAERFGYGSEIKRLLHLTADRLQGLEPDIKASSRSWSYA